MTLLDILLLLALTYGLVKGFLNGMEKELSQLLNVGIAIIVSAINSYHLKVWVTANIDLPNEPVLMLLFVMMALVLFFLLQVPEKSVVSLVDLSEFETIKRPFGAFFGWMKSIFLCSVLIYVLAPFNQELQIVPKQELYRSGFYSIIAPIAPALLPDFSNPNSNTSEQEDKNEN